MSFDWIVSVKEAEIWWALRGSNPRHLPCKGSALPAELNAHLNSKCAKFSQDE